MTSYQLRRACGCGEAKAEVEAAYRPVRGSWRSTSPNSIGLCPCRSAAGRCQSKAQAKTNIICPPIMRQDNKQNDALKITLPPCRMKR